MVLVFTLTSILSAFLVFLIQPVVAKIALPTLGGTPLVWNGCMLFFQAALLAGYGYAHFLGTRCQAARQPKIHLGMIALALLCLPVAFDRASGIDPANSPLLWLLATLATSVGIPFFVMTATSPLLQKWFSNTNHPSANHPYFLYAASNIGSMGALVLYPFLIEPALPLADQVGIWEWGIAVLGACFVCLAFILRRGIVPEDQQAVAEGDGRAVISSHQRLHWVILAFVPSSLLYGVTAYMTTDIASVPMLWILPLILYLLTFILVFERNLFGFAFCRKLHAGVTITLLTIMALPLASPAPMLLLHVLAFFIVTMVMHGQLSESKPSPRHLTEFFFWMSVGGVLGGIFNTLIAPFIFNSIAEYPLALILSLVLRLSWEDVVAQLRRDGLKILIMTLLVFGAGYVVMLSTEGVSGNAVQGNLSDMAQKLCFIFMVSVVLGVTLLYVSYKGRYAVIGLGIGLMMLGTNFLFSAIMSGQILLQNRSFFGVNKVTAEGDVHIFFHGTTMHGVQVMQDGESLKPRAYYSRASSVFDAVSPLLGSHPAALVGVGVGTLTCYGKAGEVFDLYDIDPMVIDIAQNPDLFTYMRDCPPEKRVLLGDGRQRMKEQPDKHYAVIMLDAFSSDSIPIHLITQQAMEIYKSKLADGGLIAIHISNRHIELRPVLAAVANAAGMHGYYQNLQPKEGTDWALEALWVVLAKSDDDLKSVLGADGGWKALPEPKPQYLWTDDFSNVLESLKLFHPFEEPQAEGKEAPSTGAPAS